MTGRMSRPLSSIVVILYHVSYISRQAEFTPGNVQTPEERSKQVFRIRATLDEGLDLLRPVMSADVWLEGVNDKVTGGQGDKETR